MKWKKENNVIKCLIPPKLIKKFMALFICLYILGEFHSYIQYFLIISTFGTLSTSHPPQIFLLLFPSFYFLYNPWCSVGAALVCMDVGLSTSHIPEKRTSSPSPGSHPQSEALSSSPLTCTRMLTGSVLLWYHADSGQWAPELRESVMSRRHHFTAIPLISSSDPCLLVQCFLSHIDREDRNVPCGAGYSPLPLVPRTEPVAAAVSWGKGMLHRQPRVALFPEFNDKCLEDNLMPCLLNRTTRVDSI